MLQDVSSAFMVLVATDRYTDVEKSEHNGAQLEPLRLALYLKYTSIRNLQEPIKVR